MTIRRLPDYLDHMRQAIADALSIHLTAGRVVLNRLRELGKARGEFAFASTRRDLT